MKGRAAQTFPVLLQGRVFLEIVLLVHHLEPFHFQLPIPPVHRNDLVPGIVAQDILNTVAPGLGDMDIDELFLHTKHFAFSIRRGPDL